MAASCIVFLPEYQKTRYMKEKIAPRDLFLTFSKQNQKVANSFHPLIVVHQTLCECYRLVIRSVKAFSLTL